MFYYGIKGTSLNLIQSYLSNRKQFVNYNNIMSDLLTIKMGVPQGSILGPLLFLVYMNIMYSSKYFDFIIYADDTTLSSVLTILHTIDNNNVDLELESISDWLQINELSINVDKTKTK